MDYVNKEKLIELVNMNAFQEIIEAENQDGLTAIISLGLHSIRDNNIDNSFDILRLVVNAGFDKWALVGNRSLFMDILHQLKMQLNLKGFEEAYIGTNSGLIAFHITPGDYINLYYEKGSILNQYRDLISVIEDKISFYNGDVKWLDRFKI